MDSSLTTLFDILFYIPKQLLKLLGIPTGIFDAPGISVDKDRDFDALTLICLTMSCLMSAFSVNSMMQIPFKNPMLLMMMLCCCFSSVSSSVMITRDTIDRVSRKN